MKRIVLMVVLLIAGALALVFLAVELWMLPSAIATRLMLASGSGGIGSVSVDMSGMVVETALLLFPSFLLWRACASLAAGGDRDMARHRRLHGIALIAVPPGMLAIMTVSVAIWSTLASSLQLLFFLGLSVMQLFSVVAALRILMRGGRETLETS
jgi:hypothetical protein